MVIRRHMLPSHHGQPQLHQSRPVAKFLSAIGVLLLSHLSVAAERLTADARPVSPASIQVTDLKTEHLVEPLALDTAHPRFRWLLESAERGKAQVGYQVLVAGSPEKLEASPADRWDSGKVPSDNSVEVRYAGKALASGERVFWKVRVWDEKGRPGAYSVPSFFEMGLLSRGDWQGRWIAAAKGISSPLLRRDFLLDGAVRRARVYVSGLGLYELSINGHKVGDRVLDPASTTYHTAEAGKFNGRILYATYDVTDALRTGENAIGVMLGHGWYSAEADAGSLEPGRRPYGDRPLLLLQMNIELANGQKLSVVSDGSWKSASGPIAYNDLAQGERYDARLEQPGWTAPGFSDSAWGDVSVVNAPDGALSAQQVQPVKVVQTLPVAQELTPQTPAYANAGIKIYDFGQHFSGWARVTVRGPRGARLQLQYASRLFPDQTLDLRSSETPVGSAQQFDTYTLKGEGLEVWEPRFTLHGFRYLAIHSFGLPVEVQSVEGQVVHAAVESTGSFTSSNSLLNRIHQNIHWTLRSGLQGIPQDAADRAERIAWMGDPGFTALDHLYNFDMTAFWEKWLTDIQDTQRGDGAIPMTVPDHWRLGYHFWPTWQSTYPMLVWELYQYYGDRRVLEQHYSNLRKLADYQSAAAQDDLIAEGVGGDNMEPQANGMSSNGSLNTPTALIESAHYYFNVLTVARMGEVLGKGADARAYFKRAERIKAAFNRRFYHPESHQYANGSQTSNALALQMGLVLKENVLAVLRNLIVDIRQHDMHFTGGMVGTHAVIEALSRYGATSVLYGLATQTTYPSLGDQIAKGATTVCETYECDPWNSQNMKMFATWDRFFYRDLAGIRPLSPGYRRIRIAPQPVGELRTVSATQHTVRGLISVDWIRADASFDLKVTIPTGTEADIAVPRLGLQNGEITEGAATVWRANAFLPGTPGLKSAKADEDAIVFHAGSGTYHLTIKEAAH